MLKSELAREIGIDPSVMTKRHREYCRLADIDENERYLDANTVADLRAASEMVSNGTARNWPEAVRRRLGQHVDPVPPSSVAEIIQRLSALETNVRLIAEQLGRIESSLRDRPQQTMMSRPVGPTPAPMPVRPPAPAQHVQQPTTEWSGED